ncbi:MAG: sodium:proton antiporter [Hyphomicrobiales bacterium]|nr:sodium:proton antiporter [Hyphomicrobiales bacterium]
MIWAVAFGLALTSPALAAEGLDGAKMPLLWAIPFAGMLLSIALGPLLFADVWHHHYGKISAAWGLLIAAPMLAIYGFDATAHVLFHTTALEYIPFILMLTALFTAAGGLVVRGNLHGAPVLNTSLLALGTIMASIIGTTGAAMVLIRPLLRANDNRKHNVHVVVFFIFLVANIGGSLTPIGDPPLFLGFLRGVSFSWTLVHLWPETLFAAVVLLSMFFAIDTWLYRREGCVAPDPTPDSRIAVTGLVNLGLIAVAIAAIVMSGAWKPGISLDVLGTKLELQNLLREAVMIGVTFASLALTKNVDRALNGFEWGPIVEVAKLFAAIFVTIVPVMAMLNAGAAGAFAPLVALVTEANGAPNNVAYFWLTGLLSSFLDNAPTYLVFFELAGGDAAHLMADMATTLAAISLGAVYMGANTYIGNAPNFMVYAIARRAGVEMPSFFGYMLWSGAILVPLFLVITVLFLK